MDIHDFDKVCLINNASWSEPINYIEKCPPEEIEAHVKIGLISPMVLTSMIIQRFAEEKIGKKVLFVSSYAVLTAGPNMSIYCSTKAGVNMFASCIGLEQNYKENGFEVVSIDPGMVDTNMQETTRSKSIGEFVMVDYFQKAFENGQLQEPSNVAEKIRFGKRCEMPSPQAAHAPVRHSLRIERKISRITSKE